VEDAEYRSPDRMKTREKEKDMVVTTGRFKAQATYRRSRRM